MEQKTCCAYNVTRGCRINSTVTAADSAREPLKVLKVLVEGLARDSKSSLWLTPLEHAPQLTRLFPFDLAYLDKDMKVLVAIALRPEIPAPPFRVDVASALILPFNALRSSGTEPGDQIMVCTEDELELRLAEVSEPAVTEPVTSLASASVAATRIPFTSLPELPQRPFPAPHASSGTIAASAPRGTGFTVGMNSGWQISNSTMSAAVLEPVEVSEAVQEKEAESETFGEIALTETESAEAQEELVAPANVPEPASGAVFEAVSDTAAAVEVAEPSVEADLEAVATMRQAVAAEPEAPAPKRDVEEVSNRVAELKTEVSRVPAESAHVGPQSPVKVNAPENGTYVHPVKRKKIAESVSAKVATPTDGEAGTLKKIERIEKKKESLGVLVKRFLNCEDPLPERRSIIRLLVQGLVAHTGDGATRTLYEVRDVSPTGLYLRTKERWKPGKVVSLVLQRKDATEEQYEKHVRVELKAVRSDEGGVGFGWVWPEGVEFEPWKRVHTKRSDETDADYFLRELRVTTALAFVRQICPGVTEEMKLSLHKRLSNKRVASAVEITLKAQELLARLAPRATVQAQPDMVRRILENGSWTEDDWIRQWWAGLLVSSCSIDAPDSSNSVFIDLLAKLMPVHLRVLAFVCPKAMERLAAGEPAAKLDVYCTSEELVEAVGSQSLSRIQQTMGQLSSFGLLAENNKPSYVAVTDKVKTRATPTALGLKMHARCHGHR